MHHRPRPAPRWEDQHALLLDLAVADLRQDLPVRPTLVAFAGEEPLVVASLRPFDRGAHADAIIEVGAVTMALGADRLALSLGGLAWSTADPIPPVLPDVGDLRQPVVVVHEVDGSALPARSRSCVYAVTVEAALRDGDGGASGLAGRPAGGSAGGTCGRADDEPRGRGDVEPCEVGCGGRCRGEPVVRLGEPIETTDAVGWVPQALEVMASRSGRRGGWHLRDEVGLARQVQRCERLGHDFAWGRTALARVQAATDVLVDLGEDARRDAA